MPVVDAAGLKDLLRPEGDQHRGAFRGQGAQRGDPPQTVGQNRVQTVLLLPAEDAHLAQVLARCGEDCFGIAVQLLLGIGQMNHGHKAEHHALVAVC